ncbi:MAG: hypothetical protein HY587_07675 [Candidatus Omnitrophica bacterium]|nr:hypothetical protein [Candidatus Omnitrophota bacterium]
MPRNLLVILVAIVVAFFSLNNLSLAEPPRHGGGPANHPQGNLDGGHKPQGGNPGPAMHNQAGGPGHEMRPQGMQGHQGHAANMAEHHKDKLGMDEMNGPRADRNKDGRIGPREAKAADMTRDQMKAEHMRDVLDKNNDGRIGPLERAWAEAHDGQVESDTQGNSNGSGEFMPFQGKADRNQDGFVDDFERKLAREHMMNGQEQMNPFQVEPAAFESVPDGMQNPSGGILSSEGNYKPEGFFDIADKNNDGFLGPGERKEAREHQMQNQFERKADQNHDGVSDRQERHHAKEVMQENRRENGFGSERGNMPGMRGEMGSMRGEHRGPQDNKRGGSEGFRMQGEGPRSTGGAQGGHQNPEAFQGGHGGGPNGSPHSGPMSGGARGGAGGGPQGPQHGRQGGGPRGGGPGGGGARR